MGRGSTASLAGVGAGAKVNMERGSTASLAGLAGTGAGAGPNLARGSTASLAGDGPGVEPNTGGSTASLTGAGAGAEANVGTGNPAVRSGASGLGAAVGDIWAGGATTLEALTARDGMGLCAPERAGGAVNPGHFELDMLIFG